MTNNYLERQKRQLKLIIGYIDLIQVCDGHILSGHEPEYFKAVKQDAIEQYSGEMANMVGEAMKASKVKAEA